MKSLKQVADEIGVTKNAIVMKLKRNTEFAELLREHLDNNGNVDEAGEYLIKDNIRSRSSVKDNVTDNVINVTDNVINVISNVLEVTDNVSEVTKAILNLKTENIRLETQLEAEKTAYEQRLADKDRQIEELQKMLKEQIRERQAYSAALLSANTKLSEIRHLTLTDRLFGWNNVQAMLTDNAAVSEQTANVIDAELSENKNKDKQ